MLFLNCFTLEKCQISKLYMERPVVTSSINVLQTQPNGPESSLYMSLYLNQVSTPRKTIFGERVSPVSDILMAHTHDSGFTT